MGGRGQGTKWQQGGQREGRGGLGPDQHGVGAWYADCCSWREHLLPDAQVLPRCAGRQHARTDLLLLGVQADSWRARMGCETLVIVMNIRATHPSKLCSHLVHPCRLLST